MENKLPKGWIELDGEYYPLTSICRVGRRDPKACKVWFSDGRSEVINEPQLEVMDKIAAAQGDHIADAWETIAEAVAVNAELRDKLAAVAKSELLGVDWHASYEAAQAEAAELKRQVIELRQRLESILPRELVWLSLPDDSFIAQIKIAGATIQVYYAYDESDKEQKQSEYAAWRAKVVGV